MIRSEKTGPYFFAHISKMETCESVTELKKCEPLLK